MNSEDVCDLTRAYIGTYVRHLMSIQAFRCGRRAASSDSAPDEKRKALEYLETLLALVCDGVLPVQTGPMKWCEERSARILECAIGTAYRFMAGNQQKDKVVHQGGVSAAQKKGIDWLSQPKEWARQTSYTLETWAWLSDSHISERFSTYPSIVWYSLAEKIDLRRRASWAFLSKHPSYIPLGRLQSVITGDLSTGRKQLRQNAGWIYDAVRDRATKICKYVDLEGAPEAICNLIGRYTEVGDYVPLDIWAKWTKELQMEKPFDPRVAEWTALTLTKQIAEWMNEFGAQKRRTIKIHPANYLVPAEWQGKDAVYTWERWRRAIKGRDKGLKPSSAFSDRRFTLLPDKPDIADYDRAPIQGLGMILCGLIRRSFRWPAEWNPPGQQQAWARLVGYELTSSRSLEVGLKPQF